jgi:hypothetical protein
MDKAKKESMERLKNRLEQFKLNLRLASQENDTCDIKYWTKQIKMTELIIKCLDQDKKT